MLLVSTESEASETDGRDRREFPRRDVKLKAEAMRIGNTLSAHRQPTLELAVRDLSEGGLAAMTNLPLEAGERIAMYFPSHMGQHVYDLYGRVIRCEPRGESYRIALQFDALAA